MSNNFSRSVFHSEAGIAILKRAAWSSLLLPKATAAPVPVTCDHLARTAQRAGSNLEAASIILCLPPSPTQRSRKEANAREKDSSFCAKEIIVKVGRTILHSLYCPPIVVLHSQKNGSK